jgi:ribosomal 30S subunit maturation factor RimM
VRSIWGLVKGGAAASSAKTPQTAAVSNSKSSANNQPKVQQKDSIAQSNSNKDQSNSNRTDKNPKKKQKIAGNSQESSVIQKESSEVNLDSLHVVNDIRQLQVSHISHHCGMINDILSFQIGDLLWFKLMFFDPFRLVPSTTKLIQVISFLLFCLLRSLFLW